MRLLEEHRRIVRNVLLKLGGREVKTLGDGFLVEFASALSATLHALELQRRTAAWASESKATVLGPVPGYTKTRTTPLATSIGSGVRGRHSVRAKIGAICAIRSRNSGGSLSIPAIASTG
jgi:class 3 adenylate cyclase